MLSVLIPTYNYNALPLVKFIEEQCLKAKIVFEIICQDDASNAEIYIENNSINSMAHCFFSTNAINLGRGININIMASRAKYNYILLMDCDTLPEKDSFIENYLNEIKKEETVVFGGIIYQIEKPNKENLLRWVYGKKREALTVEERTANPYYSILTSNILFKKSFFLNNLFDDKITNYGYEDVVWAKKIKDKKIAVKHIDNPAYHLNMETSEIFIKKILQSLLNLQHISKLGLLTSSDNRLLRAYTEINNIGITTIFSFIFKKFHKKIKANLVSNNPSLVLLDIYKLGYFCKINSK